jgi:outer membrane biosynthesis protein TonB
MRKSSLLLAGAGALLLAACSGDKKASINDDLKKDLELASSSDGITLANSSPNAGQQVISAIERTTPPAKQPAPSTRVKRHKPAPKSPPQVVKTEAPATVAQTEEQTVATAPVADDPTPISPRPQPVPVSYPRGPSSGGDDGRASGGGSNVGAVLGTILGAVIRGGVVGGDGDACDPRTDGRRGSGGIVINQRIPVRLPGRIGGVSRSGVSIPTGRFPGRR